MPVIKAGAYGHGLEPVARRLNHDGISFLGVANVGEARRIKRMGGNSRPFILGPSFPEEHEELVLNNWTCSLSSMEEAEQLNHWAGLYERKFQLHLAVDIGMGREGFLPSDLGALKEKLKQLPHLEVDGLMSHFPSADEDVSSTQSQIALFSDCVNELSSSFNLRYRHVAASAGLLGYDIPAANLIRPGLLLYGVAPMASIYDTLLRQPLKLAARVTLVRDLPTGQGVSYGSSYRASKPMRVATVGIGYADGWSRKLSDSGVQLCINGRLCPMIGRVTMDQIMADVSELSEVKSGDIAYLICPEQSVVDVARLAGTIPWEVLTGLGSRLPRFYSNESSPIDSALD